MAKKHKAEDSGRVSTLNQEEKKAAPTIGGFGKIKSADLPKKIAPGKDGDIIEAAHELAKATDKRAKLVKKARELNDLIDEAESEGAAEYQKALQEHGPEREDALRKAARLNDTIKARSTELVAMILDPQGKLAFENGGEDDGAD